jgi:hypothetical protein
VRKTLTLAVLILGAAGWIYFRPFALLQAQQVRRSPAPIDWAPDATRVLIRYGVTDSAAGAWKGRIEAASTGARVLAVEGLHFTQQDRASNDGNFSFATRSWEPANQQTDLSPIMSGPRAVFPNGVYAVVAGPPDAKFKVSGAGDFSFSLTELTGGRQLAFNKGNIQVELAANPALLSPAIAGKLGQADYPSIARSSQGAVAVIWQEFIDDRDRILIREMNGGKWGEPEAIETRETADVFRPSAVYDSAGSLHVVWPAQVDGNWDLYARHRGPSGWSAIERVTQNPGSDFHQKLIADSRGNLWLAWQSFRNGQSDVYLKRYQNGAWGAEMRISQSSANDWEPSVAASDDGTVWVGWDTYDKGDYDVVVRPVRNGQPGALRPITRSTRFEAHASLACDRKNRLWIAFDESTANWGKDYGYLEKTKGNPLYISRKLHVVRLDGDRLEEPSADLAAAFPLYLSRFVQNPQIAIGNDGSVTVAAMQLTNSHSVIEVWGAQGIWEEAVLQLDASGWHRAQVLPYSNGANDERASIESAGDGSLWAAWASDGRDYGNARIGRQMVFAAEVPRAAVSGEPAMKPFVEAPEYSEATHPHEAADIQAIRAYRIRSGGSEYRIMRGDLHRHTSLSSDGVGDGSLWDFYRYVLDAVNLDFSTVTDHQGGGTTYNWWKTQKSCDLYLTPSRMTTVYAYERSVLYPNGHRNIIFTKRGIPVLPIDPLENRGADDPNTKRSSDAVWPYLKKYDTIAFRHSTATDQGTDWKDHDNTLEPLVEVYQGHRFAYEHEGGPKGMTEDRLYTHRSGYRSAGYIWTALAKGYRLGFEAASDHCSTHISYSCILTKGTSRQDLVDAMRKRHTYGATDNIVLDFRVSAGGREYLQGDEVPHTAACTLKVNVAGTGAIARVAVIHNESYAYFAQGSGKREMQFSYSDPHPAAGENRYYVRVEQEDGNLAWSSPVWILGK